MYLMKLITFTLLSLFIGMTPTAFASDLNEDDQMHFDLGGAVLIGPAYVGSDQTDTLVIPYLGFENVFGIDFFGLEARKDLVDIGTGTGPGKWSLQAGPRLGFDFGRESADSPNLDGLDDIGVSALVGGYFRTTLSIIGLDLSVGQDVIGGHKGLVADASIGTRYPGDGWYISPIVTLSWADQNYTQAIYGITSKEAEISVLDKFEASGGFHQVSATLLGGVDLDEDWSLTAVISYNEAIGDYKDSPIIKADDGSASGLFTTLAISRRFSF